MRFIVQRGSENMEASKWFLAICIGQGRVAVDVECEERAACVHSDGVHRTSFTYLETNVFTVPLLKLLGLWTRGLLKSHGVLGNDNTAASSIASGPTPGE